MSNGSEDRDVMRGREELDAYDGERVPALMLGGDPREGDKVLEPGDVFSGRVVDRRLAEGEFGAAGHQVVPVVELEELEPDGSGTGERFAFWVWHDIPLDEFARKDPEVGDVLHIKRLPDGESSKYGAYRRIALVVSGKQPTDDGFSWGKPRSGLPSEEEHAADTRPGDRSAEGSVPFDNRG